MDSLDRMKAALGMGITDRVPIITFTDIDKGDFDPKTREFIRENADAQHDHLTDEISYITFPGIGCGLSSSDETGGDGWLNRRYTDGKGRDFSEILRFSELGRYRSYKKHIICSAEDIYSILDIGYIKPSENDGFLEQLGNIDASVKLYGSSEFGFFIIHDPISLICANTDPQDIAVWTLTERILIRDYLEEVSKRMLEYLEYALSGYGLDMVFMMAGAEFAIPPLMSPKDFEEFVAIYDKKIIDLLHRYDKKVILHCHGRINSFIGDFIEMGADGIHPLEPSGATGDCEIGLIKEKYGSRICLVGDVQYEDFAELDPGEMDRRIKKLMEAAKDGGGFILSPACPLFQSGISGGIERNIKAFIDAGRRYGKYS